MNNKFHLNADNLRQFVKRAEEVILRPKTLYKWDDIVLGVKVKRSNGTTQTMRAVDSNTVRALHRIDKNCPGASRVFQNYFVSNKSTLIAKITHAIDSTDLHAIENEICNDIRPNLSNIKTNILDSYGRIRKPVDLYFQNLIAMAKELSQKRIDLVPHLFLPLDSKMFCDPNVFTEEELRAYRLTRRPTFKDVKDETMYLQLQNIVSEKANKLSKENMRFCRVYFDMLWNNRHQNWGSNLFETNP